MRDDEVGRLRRVIRAGLGRPLDGDPVATEQQQVEVELARPPAGALPAPERPLQLLERDEQRDGPGRRIRAGRHVELDRRVPELGLVGHADGRRRVEPRHGAQPRARQGPQRMDAGRDRPGRVAEVRPEPDVRPRGPRQGIALRSLDSARG